LGIPNIDLVVMLVILLAQDERDIQNLPDYIKNRGEVRSVNDIQDVLKPALKLS